MSLARVIARAVLKLLQEANHSRTPEPFAERFNAVNSNLLKRLMHGAALEAIVPGSTRASKQRFAGATLPNQAVIAREEGVGSERLGGCDMERISGLHAGTIETTAASRRRRP